MLRGMSTASRPFTSLPTPVKRLVYYALGAALFVGVGAVVRPERSMAAARESYEQRQGRIVVGGASGATESGPSATPVQIPAVASKRPLLGMLVGSPYFVWVYAGPKGPLYTVADRAGHILASEVDAETLYEQCPEVSVQSLQLQPGEPGQLMMVDPASQR